MLVFKVDAAAGEPVFLLFPLSFLFVPLFPTDASHFITLLVAFQEPERFGEKPSVIPNRIAEERQKER